MPLLAYAQFPWRFLLLFCFFISWVASFVADHFLPQREAWSYIAIAAVILLLGSLHYRQHKEFRTFDAAVITPKRILDQRLPATVGDEYLPRLAQETAPVKPERQNAVEVARLDRSRPDPTRYRYCQFFPEKRSFEFGLFNFPFWKISIDGVAQLNSQQASVLTAEVPAGKHCIEARLGYLALQWVGFVLSACSLTLFAVWATWRRTTHPPK